MECIGYCVNGTAAAENYTLSLRDALSISGYGQSDKPKMEYTTEYYIGFLGRLMDALGLEKTSLVGISMGGAISLGYALRSPHRVERLVLVDSHGLGGDIPGGVASYALVRLPLLNRLVWAALKRSRKMVERSLQTVFYDPETVTKSLMDEVQQLVKKPGAGRAWRSWQENEIRRKGLHTNFVDRFQELAMPTLILHGAEDRYVPVSWADRKSTRLNSSHANISYAVFCLKKKKTDLRDIRATRRHQMPSIQCKHINLWTWYRT